jgi:hypothetical protein
MSGVKIWDDDCRDFICRICDLLLASEAQRLNWVNDVRRDLARQDAAKARAAKKRARPAFKVIAGRKD